MAIFETGKTYMGRSVCDQNAAFSITVAKRTPTTITTTKGKRLGVKSLDGEEIVFPMGRYSMAPVIRASRAV